MPKKSDELISRHYYVDEAGDGVIFNKRGKILIGTEGCSRFFMMGLLDVPNPDKLQQSFDNLRHEILSDPYFKKVPSMQPKNNKTAFAFHAKDDIPEVRREVFRLIMAQEGLRFFAVVRDKKSVLDEINKSSIRYHPNQLYDRTVARLFKQRLHTANNYVVTFAKRGTSDRTKALQDALEVAKERAQKTWKVDISAPVTIQSELSSQNANLQAVDYLLWALQRLYERREERYITYTWGICQLIHDVDDRRSRESGVYYDARNPLNLDSLKPL